MIWQSWTNCRLIVLHLWKSTLTSPEREQQIYFLKIWPIHSRKSIKKIIQWILTIDADFDAFRYTGMNAIRCDAQIRAHIQSWYSRYFQRIAIPFANCGVTCVIRRRNKQNKKNMLNKCEYHASHKDKSLEAISINQLNKIAFSRWENQRIFERIPANANSHFISLLRSKKAKKNHWHCWSSQHAIAFVAFPKLTDSRFIDGDFLQWITFPFNNRRRAALCTTS